MTRRALIGTAAAAAVLAFPATSSAQLDGSLDLAFDGPLGGGNGKFTHAVSATFDRGQDVLVQPDGKILVVGLADNAGVSEAALARFNANGTLDASFDGPTGTGNGDFTLDLSATGNSIANAVTLDSLNRIVIGGSADFPGLGRENLVMRLDLTDGDFDTTFGGGDGRATISFSTGDDTVSAVTTDSLDRPILTGSSANDFTIARFESDGDHDNTFSGDGEQTVDIGTGDVANGVVVQPTDGKIVIGARTQTPSGGFDFGVARLNPADGSLDTNFDGPSTGTSTAFPGNGKFAIPLSPGSTQDSGLSLLMQGNDKILVGGEAGSPGVFAIVRLDVSDGALDAGFDGDGIVTTDISTTNDQVLDMEIDSRGRILAAGSGFPPGGQEVAVARYSADGVLDPFFDGDSGSGNGIIEIPFTGGGLARGVDLAPDGDLVLAGDAGGTAHFAMARLQVDLAEPNTFLAGVTGPTNNTDPAFTITSTETASSVPCTIDTVPVACAIGAGQQFGPFDEGPHTLTAAAVDQSGNVDSVPATRAFTVDTVAPNGSITGGTGLTNDTTPALSFSSEAGSTFQCKLDPPLPGPPGSFGPCTSPFTASPLSDGEYTFTVRTTDAATNLDGSDAVATFTVDATAPQTTVAGGASSITFSSEPSSTFECSLDGAGFASCTSPLTPPALAPGAHSFAVRATDLAGNVDPTPAVLPITVDPPPPAPTKTVPPAPTKTCKKGQKLKNGKCVKKKRKKR